MSLFNCFSCGYGIIGENNKSVGDYNFAYY